MTIQTSNIFTKNCISCKMIDLAEAQRTLFTTKHCRVVLRTDDQSWLGRCIIVPRRHIPTFDQMLLDERQDVYDCRDKVNKAYRKLFGMTYDNWAQLGNLTRDHENNETTDLRYFHMHYHLIPRYQQPIEYLGKTFNDVQFGKPLNIDPARGHQKVVLSAQELFKLRDDIQEELISKGLISAENLVDTSPSERIRTLCAKNKNPHFSPWQSAVVITICATIVFGFLKSRI